MKSNYIQLLALLIALSISACTTEQPQEAVAENTPIAEATSLSGTPLYAPEMAEERRVKLQADYDAAKQEYEANPDDADNIIWLGRRAGYLWQYKKAVSHFTQGIEKHPNDARMYRHRGHRYITLRQFDKAVADFEKAVILIEGTEDVIEPDGAPNAAGIPTSTLHTNIWYHLGLAHYLQGNFEAARAAYEACMAAATNNDMRIATADWLYMTMRRLGQAEEAAEILVPITEGMEIIENHAYHRRLMMYKGERTPASLLSVEAGDDRSLNLATQGYGVGNWYLYNDQPDKARAIFKEVLQGDYWAAFGYIAAEAELVRLGE
ncbi:MAG: tetratricopeptide repeat protein [Rhodothermales bacterium]